MAKLRTIRVPAAFGDHEWNTTEDVVDVADTDAVELLRIPDAGFVEVLPGEETKPAARGRKITEPDPDA